MPEKLRDPRLNYSQEIPPAAVGGGMFDGFFQDNFPSEIDSDVISGVIAEPTDLKVRGIFGDSRSNNSRDMPQMREERTMSYAHHKLKNAILGFCLKSSKLLCLDSVNLYYNSFLSETTAQHFA